MGLYSELSFVYHQVVLLFSRRPLGLESKRLYITMNSSQIRFIASWSGRYQNWTYLIPKFCNRQGIPSDSSSCFKSPTTLLSIWSSFTLGSAANPIMQNTLFSATIMFLFTTSVVRQNTIFNYFRRTERCGGNYKYTYMLDLVFKLLP